MILEEKTMKTEKLYEGRILNLRVDTVELSNKKYSKREIIEQKPAVVIIALDEEENVLLVRALILRIRKCQNPFLRDNIYL